MITVRYNCTPLTRTAIYDIRCFKILWNFLIFVQLVILALILMFCMFRESKLIHMCINFNVFYLLIYLFIVTTSKKICIKIDMNFF